ncbi:MAG: hypothetical protein WBB55_09135, partial [Anaerolineales bacterium]
MSSSPKYKSVPVRPSEITPEYIYLNRRHFLKSMGILGVGALLAAACGISEDQQTASATKAGSPAGT